VIPFADIPPIPKPFEREQLNDYPVGHRNRETFGSQSPDDPSAVLGLSGGGSTSWPLKVRYSADGEAKVTYGIVKGSNSAEYVPTIGGTSLASDPTLSVTANGYVYLSASVDGSGFVTGATISFTSGSVPASDATNARIMLAQITGYSSGAFVVNQATSGSLAHMVCTIGETDSHLWGRI
jgi:hypothetical protein